MRPSRARKKTAAELPPLATVCHLCLRHRHRISLLANGRLLFHNHTVAELRRYLNFVRLGGEQTCACATFYHEWVTRSSTVYGELSRECADTSWLSLTAHRLQRRLALSRRYPVITSPSGASEAYQIDVTRRDRLWFAAVLEENLKARGYPVRCHQTTVYYIPDPTLAAMPESDFRIARIRQTGNWCVAVNFAWHGHGHGPDRGYIVVGKGEYDSRDGDFLHITRDDKNDPPIRFIADQAQRNIITHLLRQARERNWHTVVSYVSRYVANIADQLKTGGSLVVAAPSHDYHVPDRAGSLADLRFALGGVTVQAAALLAEEFQKLSERIRRLGVASDKRIQAAGRFPPAPGPGVGPAK